MMLRQGADLHQNRTRGAVLVDRLDEVGEVLAALSRTAKNCSLDKAVPFAPGAVGQVRFKIVVARQMAGK